jgi:hypothetical protein
MSEKSHNIPCLDSLQEEYLKTLCPKQLKGYHIAKSHLGSSFSLEKSNGFLEWKKKKDVK